MIRFLADPIGFLLANGYQPLNEAARKLARGECPHCTMFKRHGVHADICRSRESVNAGRTIAHASHQ
jgi:hypothetical protein